MNMRKRDRGTARKMNRETIRWVLAVGSALLFLLGLNQVAFAEGAEIWDNDTAGWTTIFGDGDPIDTGTANAALSPQLAIDSNNRVYVTFYQGTTIPPRIYLSRYDAANTRAQIWENSPAQWTTIFGEGEPIDAGSTILAFNPQLAIDSNDSVYVAYSQFDLAFVNHIYLSRYNGTDVRVWDDGNKSWTNAFGDGDPIDTNTANPTQDPQLAIDSNDIAYVTYKQNDGANNHIYLSRFDGTNVSIWENSPSQWTTTFSDGEPIDTGTLNHAAGPQLAVDSNNNVYITYAQVAGVNHIYLSRYNAVNARVEVWDDGPPSDWATTFPNGVPIDTGAALSATGPQLAIDSTGTVYIVFVQNDHIYLSRYDAAFNRVEIWDDGISDWTTNLGDGDPIDADSGIAKDPQLAIDSNDFVYVTFTQAFGAEEHIFLSRYNGMDVMIWDKDVSAWKIPLSDGKPIDTGTANNAEKPQLAIDSNNRVYVTYAQVVGGAKHIYLSRYNKIDVRIWDATGWTTNFVDGDPIDTGTLNDAQGPQLAIDSNDRVYVSYSQLFQVLPPPQPPEDHIYLSRYAEASTPALLTGGGGGGVCFISTSMDGSLFAP